MKKIYLIIMILYFFPNYLSVKNEHIKSIISSDKIVIDSISLNQNFYPYKVTDISKNITMLEKSNPYDNMFILASHSGNSNISFFKNLDKIKRYDKITIIYNQKTINYFVEDIVYHVKNAPFFIDNKKDYLYLVTCDKYNNSMQMIVKCKKMTKNVKKLT